MKVEQLEQGLGPSVVGGLGFLAAATVVVGSAFVDAGLARLQVEEADWRGLLSPPKKRQSQ